MKEEEVSREKKDEDDRIVIEGSTSEYGRYGSEGLEPGRDPSQCVYTGGCHGNAPRRHDARTPLLSIGLGSEPVPVSFNLIAAIFPIRFLFWSCRGLRVPLFLALNTPLFSSSGRWLEDL